MRSAGVLLVMAAGCDQSSGACGSCADAAPRLDLVQTMPAEGGDGGQPDLESGSDLLPPPPAWSIQPLPIAANAIWGSGANDVFAVGSHGEIIHSTDRGQTWKFEQSGVTSWLWDIWGSGPGEIYVVGQGDGNTIPNVILHSTDDGQTWVRQGQSLVQVHSFSAVFGNGAGDVYAANILDDILQTGDHGATWTLVDSGGSGSHEFRDIWASGDRVVAVGSIGAIPTIFASVDGTRSWFERQPSGLRGGDGFEAIWASAPGDIYAVTSYGAIVHSEDTISWTVQRPAPFPGTDDLRDIWGSGQKDVYVVGGAGTILHSIDRGKTWAPENSGAPHDELYCIWGSGPHDVYVLGYDGYRQDNRTTSDLLHSQ